MGSVFQLQVRQMLSERRAFFLGLFIALPMAIFLVVRIYSPYQPDGSEPVQFVTTLFLGVLYPQVMCELLALLYATTLLSSELEGQTLTYLFTRPVGKTRVIVGKYLAIWAVLTPPILVSLWVSWLVLGMPAGLSQVLSLSLTVVLSLMAYIALFALLGILFPARAMVMGLVFSMAEFALSFVPAVLNYLTVTYYLRSVVVRWMGAHIEREAQRIVGNASLPLALLALVAITCVALGASCLAASQQEYIVGKVS